MSESGDVASSKEAGSDRDRLRSFVAGGWKVIMPPLALFFYYFASEKLGFWLCAFVIVLTLAKSMGATFRSAILLGLSAPGVIHLIFYKLLRVPLPAGLLPFPWV
ncbi:MAG: hypothetical protein EBW55_00515 [Betaproteobacteria bacterium]|nr:hypothetical protein [Betaproteobacteria bacterium]